MYRINFKKELELMDDKEYNELVQDFEEKFINFKKDRCQGLSLIESVEEYSDYYEIDIRIICEIIQSSKMLSQLFKDHGNKTKSEDIW